MQHCYWNATRKPPPPQFLQALREYEALHQRCVGNHNLTELFVAGKVPEGCKYLVWKEQDGKGNQIMSLVSAFIYSLLTKRTLLTMPSLGHVDGSLHHLLCEPFPGSSWKLPPDFPLDAMLQQTDVQWDYFHKVDNLTKNGSESYLDASSTISPSRLYITLSNYNVPDHEDRRFFCPAEQTLLSRIPWLVLKSNNYIAAGFYFLPEYRQALNQLFPDRAMFLHAGRYLLNPRNDIWGRITRFYDGYLLNADKKIGIQVRSWKPEYNPILSDHILRCATLNNILPNVTQEDTAPPTKTPPERVTVLMTGLVAQYHHDVREKYLRNANVRGDSISVLSPSSEGVQQTGDVEHDKKALADMWLLSFMDDLVSSPKSTFGYVAHGLAGITPYVFVRWGFEDYTQYNGCERSNLAGPCYIDTPHGQECPLDPPGTRIGDPNAAVPEIQHCRNQWGVGVFPG